MNAVTNNVPINDLLIVIQKLSLAKDLPSIVQVIKTAARRLTHSDGATFVLRDGDKCYYVDEDAIAPLWKGLRFPLDACVSGWAMLNKKIAAIPDIYQDARVPIDAYKPTFVKSMVMTPIRKENPIGAIGTYWATPHETTPDELRVLEALAESTSIALMNVQLLDDLNHQLSLRDEFLAIAAHELRTPLTPLKLQIQLLDKYLKDAGPQVRKALQTVQNQTKDLSQLVETILDVSNMSMGFFKQQKSKTDLCQVIQESVNQLRLTSQGEIKLNMKGPIYGNWDSARLSQVARNLITNAIKFGNGKSIEISAELKDGSAKFNVTDHGIGIKKDDQSRIFRRFERGQNYSNVGGMGLGLFVANKIVEDYKGGIFVQSELNKGSTFTVELPLQ